MRVRRTAIGGIIVVLLAVSACASTEQPTVATTTGAATENAAGIDQSLDTSELDAEIAELKDELERKDGEIAEKDARIKELEEENALLNLRVAELDAQANPPLPETIHFEGTSTGVYDLPAPLTDGYRFTAKHSGSSNFAIWGITANGEQRGLLVNDIGVVEESGFEEPPLGGSIVAFEVESADGFWTLDVTPN